MHRIHPRFTLRTMMTLVLVVGGLFASLRSLAPMSPAWHAVGLNFPIVLLLIAPLLARFGRRETSAWWFGFSVFGWAQLVLGTTLVRFHDDSLMPVTHRATMALASWYWDTDPAHQFTSLRELTLNPGYGGLLEVLYVKANALVSLGVGAAGGLAIHVIAVNRDRRRRAADASPTSRG